MVDHRTWIAVYMMANRYYGAIYIGVTSQLLGRVQQHREGELPGFTRKYALKRLVWFESFEFITSAIRREKSLKEWPRQWKINLIERDNPRWDDMYPSLVNEAFDPKLWSPPRESIT